jgi:hypothetical protein
MMKLTGDTSNLLPTKLRNEYMVYFGKTDFMFNTKSLGTFPTIK